MQQNWLTLRFTGPHGDMEKDFRLDHIRRNLPQIRLALVAGLSLYLLFAILDALAIPAMKHITWLIRFVYVAPLILTVFFLTWRTRWHSRLQPLLASTFIGSGTGIVVMIAIIPSPMNVYYYVGLILVFIFGYTLISLRFVWGAFSGLLISILYGLAAWQVGIPRLEMLSISFFLLGANLGGMLACYNIEYTSRRNFFLLHNLEAERQKTEQLNNRLEQRVLERTEKLEVANQQLVHEMAERQQAEEIRQRLEAQLKQAEKMETIGKLAAGVAHDLNNQLIGLVTYPEFLLQEVSLDSSVRGHIQTIRQSGLKAAAIVQDLLALSRQGAVENRVFNLNPLITEYLADPAFLQIQKSSPQITLDLDQDPELLNVIGSPVQLLKVVMNLVINAYEANLTRGDIRITTSNRTLDRVLDGFEPVPEGEYVVLSVLDTGVGIEEENLRHVFEPFFTKKKLGRSGTGLGMTLIWTIVKDHRGFIDIRSREGLGTEIEIFLPGTRLSVSGHEEPQTLEDCLGKETVLVVDDMAEQREISALMLQKLGYRVHTVPSGEDAVSFLTHKPADILILDMIMDPGMDGLDTYRRISMDHPGQKALIVSGYSKSDRVREAQRLGAGAFVRKPYTLLQIARALRRELDRRPQESVQEES
jgi:signal transduction histidine kinase/ActR/RegA family two-component response regulator